MAAKVATAQRLDAGRPARQGGGVAEMQRRRLLLATTELVGEAGLEAASVGAICARAGVSRRTFYELFEDRQVCFLAAIEGSVKRLRAHVLGVCQPEAQWQERIRTGLSAVLEALDTEPGLARVLLIETLRASPEALGYRRSVLDELHAEVDVGRGCARRGSEPVALTAESTVGGVLAVLHARLLQRDPPRLMELLNPLMGMIVQPYLGAGAARREREQPPSVRSQGPSPATSTGAGRDPFKDLPIRFTYRTARVIAMIESRPGASNRQIGDAAGVHDQGQISRLLRRLERNGLISNQGEGRPKGEANAWRLTPRGQAVQAAISATQAA